MKNLLILSVLLLVITSCSKYQINVLSSTDISKDPQTGKFITENDSIRITYSFFGRNAPINLEVYNKLNEPLYIDWQRSSFITDGKSVSYATNQVNITGEVSGSSVGNRTISFSSGSIDAIATLPKNTVFIPPHTFVNNTLLEVTSQYINDEYFGITQNKEIPSLSISGASEVKIGEFTPDKSPLNFKSYLTVYTLNGNVPKYSTYQHRFFVSKVISTSEEPENFDFFPARRGDFFYTSKATTGGKLATGVGIAALAVGSAAVMSANQPEYTK